MIDNPEDQDIDLQNEQLDTSLDIPEIEESESEPPEELLDLDQAESEFNEEEEYNKKADDGDWSSQDITNIASGAGAGVARAFTGTLSLAADLVDVGAEAAGFEGFSDKTLADIHSTLDISDNIAELTGADIESQGFKTSRAISEGITIGLQMMVGIGAASAGAKLSRALITKGGAKGVGRLAKKGAQAVASGSKAKVAGKAAGVVAGEELLSQENANEGGFLIDTFLRDAEAAEAEADSVHTPVMNILNRTDPDLTLMADEYLAINPKGEADSLKRLTNRLEGVLDGLVIGGGIALTAKTAVKYFKVYKQTKYNASVAKDFKVDDAFVNRQVAKANLKGEEVTDEMLEGFKAKAKEARKAEAAKNFEEIENTIDKSIFGKKGILEEVRAKVKETSEFFEDENIIGVFNKMSSGAATTRTYKTVEINGVMKEVAVDEDVNVFRQLARSNDRIAKLTGKKKDFFVKASDREIADVMQDKRFLAATQKKFVVDRELVTRARLDVTEKMGAIKTQVKEALETTGKVPAKLLLAEQGLRSADSALGLKSSSMNSLSGQFLRLAKDDKALNVSSINRFIESQRSKFNSDVLFTDFEAKMYSDPDFRAVRMGAENAGKTSPLMQKLDVMHDFYRQHLLTSVKGVVRNVSEGVVLSGIRMARDVIADPRNIKAIKATFNRDNTNIALARFKHAMQGKSDFDTATKLGHSIIEEHATISDGIKGTILEATGLGRRSVIAGDKLISTYNEAYYMNKQIMNGMDELAKDSQNIEILARKLRGNESLTSEEMRMFNNFSTKGINPIDFIKELDDKGFEGAMDFALESMQKSPDLIMGSKKYADKIAMNMDIDDMGATANFFSTPALTLSEWPATRMFMPFPRPALSALDETIEWTPIMNLPRLAKRFKEGTPQARREAIVQAGMSLTGGAAVWELFTQGMLTGSGPKEPRANKAWRSFNQPNSINIGGQSISVQGTVLGSIGNIIGEAHDIMETHDDGSIESDEKKKLIAAGITSVLAELPTSFWTDSLDPLLRALKPQGAKSLESSQAALITNLVKSTPLIGLGVQGLSQIASGTNSEKADTSTRTGEEPLSRAWNEFKKNVPFMDVPKRVSFITGETLESGNTWKKPVLSMSSFQGTEHKDVGNYINALIQDSGAKNSRSTRDHLRFTEPERSIKSTGIDKVSYKLSADEYEEITRLTSQPSDFPPMVEAIREIMEEMPLEEMQTQQDKDFATAIINKTMNEYKKAAREEFKFGSEDYQAWQREQTVKMQDREDEKASLNI
jgi:hypothetical protein